MGGWRPINPVIFQVLFTSEKIYKVISRLKNGDKLEDISFKERAKIINDLRRWGLYVAYEKNKLLPLWKRPQKATNLMLVEVDELVNKFYYSKEPIYLFYAHLRNNLVAHMVFSKLYQVERLTVQKFAEVVKEVMRELLTQVAVAKIAPTLENTERLVKNYLKPLARVSDGEIQLAEDTLILRLSINTLYAAEILGVSEERYLNELLNAWKKLLSERGRLDEWYGGARFSYGLRQVVDKMPEKLRNLPLQEHLRYIRRLASTYQWIILYEDIAKYSPGQWERYILEIQPV
ncbi:MAG: hypothetical protein ACP5IE_03320 [Infirmifilum sp.]|jgi:hypothetical protein